MIMRHLRSLSLTVAICIATWATPVWAKEYLAAVQDGPEIPGQSDFAPLIPQGLWGLGDGRYVVSGYWYFGQPSHPQLGMVGPAGLYVLGGDAPHCIVVMHDGVPLMSHAGGIAIAGDVIYIASGRDGLVYRGVLDTSAPTLAVEPVLRSPVPSSFVTIDDDGHLWVGQFYNGSGNHLGEWHRGRHVWRAVAIAFDRETYRPQKAIALRRQVQGMILSQDRMVLSMSWGQRNNSTLAIYPDPRLQQTSETLNLPDGSTIPLFLPLGRVAEYTLPPMAEEIWLDPDSGAVWMAYESAALRRFPRVRSAHRQSHLQAYRIPHWDEPEHTP